jgi:GNAT superfamily N-acetyltransferase
MTAAPLVIPADPRDAAVLADVIAAAFHPLDVSRWLIPDEAARRDIFPAYFQMYVEHAMDDGIVLTDPTRSSVALWLPAGPGKPQAPDGYDERLATITGPHLRRFQQLDQAFDQHHPTGIPHQHLAILATRPDRQRTGLGTALLNTHHAILDQDQTPAYLEASDLAKRAIYLGFGYADHGDAPIALPDGGPVMWPMWRDPPEQATRI